MLSRYGRRLVSSRQWQRERHKCKRSMEPTEPRLYGIECHPYGARKSLAQPFGRSRVVHIAVGAPGRHLQAPSGKQRHTMHETERRWSRRVHRTVRIQDAAVRSSACYAALSLRKTRGRRSFSYLSSLSRAHGNITYQRQVKQSARVEYEILRKSGDRDRYSTHIAFIERIARSSPLQARRRASEPPRRCISPPAAVA